MLIWGRVLVRVCGLMQLQTDSLGNNLCSAQSFCPAAKRILS